MEENFKNKLGITIFILLILSLAIGGFFFTNYILKTDRSINNKEEKKISYKIDNKKEYIYFINNEVISEGAEIYYQDVVVNLTTQTTLNEALKKENEIYKNNIKYISDMNLMSNELVNYNNDNLYALTFREYKTYEYDKYISLVINDYNYSCFDLITYNKSKGYIFDVETGMALEEKDIFYKYNTNLDKIKEQIRSELLTKQSVVDEVEVIKIEDTINDLNYALYINEYGHLFISYLVKTTQVDYNEIMEVK